MYWRKCMIGCPCDIRIAWACHCLAYIGRACNLSLCHICLHVYIRLHRYRPKRLNTLPCRLILKTCMHVIDPASLPYRLSRQSVRVPWQVLCDSYWKIDCARFSVAACRCFKAQAAQFTVAQWPGSSFRKVIRVEQNCISSATSTRWAIEMCAIPSAGLTSL